LAKPQSVDPVKLFVAALWSDGEALQSALGELRRHWGDMDYIGADHPFDLTDYYQSEMGGNLNRRILSFIRLVPPDCLCRAKHISNEIEDHVTGEKGRLVNLDIGYLDHNKIVLASFKGAGQKIYLGEGVWADMVARYRQGKYQPFEWTFPDFRDGRYDSELNKIRRIYLEQLRNLKPGPRSPKPE
jgi:hypothetical protein